MFIYHITFLGGSTINIRANTPKEAWQRAGDKYKLEVIRVKFMR